MNFSLRYLKIIKNVIIFTDSLILSTYNSLHPTTVAHSQLSFLLLTVFIGFSLIVYFNSPQQPTVCHSNKRLFGLEYI